MKFKTITCRNFLSIGNNPFTLDLNEEPITLITGPSGSGKSTIFLAIPFALFGRTPRRIKKTAYANSINKKNCEVTVVLEHNSKIYDITRGLNPAVLSVKIDGVQQEKNAASKDDQEWLENTLNINYETFVQTILISIMGYSPFLTLEAAKRREVVDNVFGLSVLTNMNAVYKKRLYELNSSIQELQGRKNVAESNEKILTDTISSAERSAFENAEYLEKELKSIVLDIDKNKKILDSIDYTEISKELEDYSVTRNNSISLVQDTENILNKHKAAGVEAKRMYDLLNTAKISDFDYIFSLNEFENHYKEDYYTAVKKISDLDVEIETCNLKIREFDYDVEQNKKKLKKVQDTPNVCYACGQDMKQEHILENKKAVDDLTKELKNCLDQLIYWKNKSIELKNKRSEQIVFQEDFIQRGYDYQKSLYFSKIKDIKVLYLEAKTQYDDAIEKKNSLDLDWVSLNTKKSEYLALDQLVKSLFDKRASLIKTKERLDGSADKEIQIKKNSLILLRESLTGLQKKLIILQDSLGNYQIVGKLLKDSGLKAMMMKQYLDLTNSLMQKYIEMFGLDVKFSFNENFEETIKSRGRDEYEYFSLSNGERMRLDLAMLFSWREIYKIRTGNSVNTLFFDEVFDSSLDSEGRASLIPIFDNLKSDTNIFIISHSPDHLAENDVEHIEVCKVNGFSQYKEAV